jgi:F-type H+-transporting ATPase subunit epsilon
MASFTLKIMTPTQVAFEGEAEMVVAVGKEGEFGILPYHSPMITYLQEGVVRVYQRGQIAHRFLVTEGWSLTQDNKATFLVHKADPA